jgi:hypothetical protein
LPYWQLNEPIIEIGADLLDRRCAFIAARLVMTSKFMWFPEASEIAAVNTWEGLLSNT